VECSILLCVEDTALPWKIHFHLHFLLRDVDEEILAK